MSAIAFTPINRGEKRTHVRQALLLGGRRRLAARSRRSNGQRDANSLVRSLHSGGAGRDRAAAGSDCAHVSNRNCGFWLPETTSKEKEIKLKEKKNENRKNIPGCFNHSSHP
jgi:hypothetical protein